MVNSRLAASSLSVCGAQMYGVAASVFVFFFFLCDLIRTRHILFAARTWHILSVF